MEKQTEREVKKLLNVLRRMAKTARINQWTGVREHADEYSVEQYNRILNRLQSLEATAAEGLFAPLPGDATWSMLSNACRDLGAYYETDPEPPEDGNGQRKGFWANGVWIDPSMYKHNLPNELNELGSFIREKIAEWQDRKRPKPGV